jgi:hypothetical protein
MLGTKASEEPSGKGRRKKEVSGKGGKGRFRETLWFKKGALDAEAAEQAAHTDPKRAGLPVSDKVDEMPMEDRYEDDGSIDAHDKQAFSLRTGHTQAMRAMDKASAGPGASDVSEDDLISEMKGGRGKVIVLVVAAVVLVAAVAIFFATRGGGDDSEEDKTEETTPAATPG